MNNKLLIKNGSVVLPGGISENTDILAVGGKIADIGKAISADDADIVDVRGNYVFPGFIDAHIHGGGGADFMDGTPEAFETAVKAHLKKGTTTLVPTAMTASKEELMELNGIGDVISDRIINYRETNGDFETIEDLLEIKGITRSTLENISPYIKTNDP